jgi:hypothetical protein
VRGAGGRVLGLHCLGGSSVPVGLLAHPGGHHEAGGIALEGLEDGAIEVEVRDRLDPDLAGVLKGGATSDGGLALDRWVGRSAADCFIGILGNCPLCTRLPVPRFGASAKDS